MTAPGVASDARTLERAAALAQSVPTPFFAYDLAAFAARAEMLQTALPPGSRLLYSAKANPHREILVSALAAGCGLELASPGELDRALNAGADPSTVLIVGPGKTDAFLGSALAVGVRRIVVESTGEVTRLASAARRVGVGRVEVLVRLSLEGARGSLRMSQHQFGVDPQAARTCRALINSATPLTFAGWHGYLASQLLDAADVVHNTQLILEEVETLGGVTGMGGSPLVDVGGGFGIPYLTSDDSLNLGLLRRGLVGLASAHPWADLAFESGRFLAGPMGILVTRVIEVKRVHRRWFVLLDAGINTSGIFGGSNAIRPLRHAVVRDGARVIDDDGAVADICGPLCTPMDRLATSVSCGARVGDLVVWWNMGAYGITAAPSGFLSFPVPSEVFAELWCPGENGYGYP